MLRFSPRLSTLNLTLYILNGKKSACAISPSLVYKLHACIKVPYLHNLEIYKLLRYDQKPNHMINLMLSYNDVHNVDLVSRFVFLHCFIVLICSTYINLRKTHILRTLEIGHAGWIRLKNSIFCIERRSVVLSAAAIRLPRAIPTTTSNMHSGYVIDICYF